MRLCHLLLRHSGRRMGSIVPWTLLIVACMSQVCTQSSANVHIPPHINPSTVHVTAPNVVLSDVIIHSIQQWGGGGASASSASAQHHHHHRLGSLAHHAS
ncbi:hypothetical protein JKP88DRAFT_31973 [Tribonema minus]|uniref:Uncharacterized protein n=1 Tax=Tribonema minus TaxID=303371 RepID=A0A836CLE0_9STRA|nr:hypothetical protein JKP88DRAFT_31973 [Tribonema minus]